MKFFYAIAILTVSNLSLASFFIDYVLHEKQKQMGRDQQRSDGIADSSNFLRKIPKIVNDNQYHSIVSLTEANGFEFMLRKLKNRIGFTNETITLDDKNNEDSQNPTKITAPDSKQPKETDQEEKIDPESSNNKKRFRLKVMPQHQRTQN